MCGRVGICVWDLCVRERKNGVVVSRVRLLHYNHGSGITEYRIEILLT